MSGTVTDRRRLRILAVVNDFAGDNLVLIIDTSLTAARVGRELQALYEQRDCPTMIVSDTGTELTSTGVLQWVHDTGVIGITSSLGN